MSRGSAARCARHPSSSTLTPACACGAPLLMVPTARTADARRMQRVFGVRSAWILAGECQVPIKRDEHGVPHVYAQTEADLYRGIGNCHGDRSRPADAADPHHRPGPRLRAPRCERRHAAPRSLLSPPEPLRPAPTRRSPRSTPRVRELAHAYCAGVNEAFAERRRGSSASSATGRRRGRSPTWCSDSRVIGYVGLAQSQGDMERLLVEMVQAGVPRAHLDELFPGQLAGARRGAARARQARRAARARGAPLDERPAARGRLQQLGDRAEEDGQRPRDPRQRSASRGQSPSERLVRDRRRARRALRASPRRCPGSPRC